MHPDDLCDLNNIEKDVNTSHHVICDHYLITCILEYLTLLFLTPVHVLGFKA